MSHVLFLRGAFTHHQQQVEMPRFKDDLDRFCDDEVLNAVEARMRTKAIWTSAIYFGIPMLISFTATAILLFV